MYIYVIYTYMCVCVLIQCIKSKAAFNLPLYSNLSLYIYIWFLCAAFVDFCCSEQVTVSGVGFRDARATYMDPHAVPSGTRRNHYTTVLSI
jgi:hypothetical protein